jgi:polyferredoxin
VDVIRDRRVLAREVEGRYIENVYKFNVMNTLEREQRFEVRVEGLPGIKMERGAHIEAEGASTAASAVAVRIPVEQAKPGSHTVYFTITSQDDSAISTREKAAFFVPK